MEWTEGDWIVRREVLTHGIWMGTIVKVIEDSPQYLITYIPEGSPFGFPDGDWPTLDRKHPWSDRHCWEGHGCLMIQEPGSSHAIWHFWHGEKRKFTCWYINLQTPFRRTAVGYDTQDLELDLVVFPDGRWEIKDEALMDQRVREGRWTKERVDEIRIDGGKIAQRLASGERWWPLTWRNWMPDPTWVVPDKMPVGWATSD